MTVITIEQPKFRGFSMETHTWHYGHGWFACDYTKAYKQQKNIHDRAMLYTSTSAIECERQSMGRFVKTIPFGEKAIDLYEGDIIEDVTNTQKRYQIIWDNNEAMFLFVPLFDTNIGAIQYSTLAIIHGHNLYPVATVFEQSQLNGSH